MLGTTPPLEQGGPRLDYETPRPRRRLTLWAWLRSLVRAHVIASYLAMACLVGMHGLGFVGDDLFGGFVLLAPLTTPLTLLLRIPWLTSGSFRDVDIVFIATYAVATLGIYCLLMARERRHAGRQE